jgi:hypothetical protein
MIKLDAGNVPLKPSHRRQLMTWLKRSLRLGQQLGDFALKITLSRAGRGYEARAAVHDAAGDFRCRTRRADVRDLFRELARMITSRLHAQQVARAA